jgi:hypothetical protein
MFTLYGIDLCTVRYTDGATGEPIDRLAALGHDHWTTTPTGDRTLKDFASVSRQARSICKKTDRSDVRVDAKCAVERGWVQVASGKVNACHATADELAEGREIRRPYKKAKQ